MRASTVIEVAVSSMQMDFAGLVLDGRGDVEFILASGERLLAYGAILKTRQHRINCDQIFETPAPLPVGGGWAWPVKSHVSYEMLVGIVDFLYSGLRERCVGGSELYDHIFCSTDPAHDEAHFFEDVKQLKAQREFCDLELEVLGPEGGRVLLPVHKFVLTSRCAPMGRMLSADSGFREASQKVVFLEEQEEVLRSILTFLYEDTIEFDGESVSSVLAAAMKWDLPRLANLAEAFIADALDSDVLLKVFEMADDLDARQLKCLCKSEAREIGSVDLARREDFQLLPLALQAELVFEVADSRQSKMAPIYRAPIVKRINHETFCDMELRDILDIPACRVALELIEFKIQHPEQSLEPLAKEQAKKLWRHCPTVALQQRYFAAPLEWLRLSFPPCYVHPSKQGLAAIMIKMAEWLSHVVAVAKVVKDKAGVEFERRRGDHALEAMRKNLPPEVFEHDGATKVGAISFLMKSLLHDFDYAPFHLAAGVEQMTVKELHVWFSNVTQDPFWLAFVGSFPVQLTPKTFYEFKLSLRQGQDVLTAIVSEMSKFTLSWPPTQKDARVYEAYQRAVEFCERYNVNVIQGRHDESVELWESVYEECMSAVSWSCEGRSAASTDEMDESDNSVAAEPFQYFGGTLSPDSEGSVSSSLGGSSQGSSSPFSFSAANTPSPAPPSEDQPMPVPPPDSSVNLFQSLGSSSASKKRASPNRRHLK
jgi:hypothetical protein